MTTTREAALEAALKLARNRLHACAIDYPTGSREMAERSEWADEATAALSTPATEPQGYVEITEEMIVAGRKAADDQYYKWRGFGPREEGQGLDGMHFIVSEALRAALSTPAADTRVVTVAQLKAISLALSKITGRDTADEVALDSLAAEVRSIRAIIGNATPAQSDKIAEAARVPDLDPVQVGEISNYYGGLWIKAAGGVPYWSIEDYSGDTWEVCPMPVFAALRALAGQGETP